MFSKMCFMFGWRANKSLQGCLTGKTAAAVNIHDSNTQMSAKQLSESWSLFVAALLYFYRSYQLCNGCNEISNNHLMIPNLSSSNSVLSCHYKHQRFESSDMKPLSQLTVFQLSHTLFRENITQNDRLFQYQTTKNITEV